MTRPFLYHVWDLPGFDDVGPFESIRVDVPTILDPAIKEGKRFYSLRRDFEALRLEGVTKGIVDDTVTEVGTSSQGREIWALKVGKGNRHKVLFTGCHHAREWISIAVPYYVAEYLIKNYTDTPTNAQERRIKKLVDTRVIWFIPMVNPDGHMFTIQNDRRWRPNRRSQHIAAFNITRNWTADGRLTPSLITGGHTEIIGVPEGDYIGVDINRNYAATRWGIETAKDNGVKTSRDPRNSLANSIWCGPSAGSEPETEAISTLIQSQGFRSSITYHNFSQLILFPDASSTDDFVQDVGKGMAELVNETASPPYTYESGSTLYETTGDAMEFSFEQSPGRPTFTPELRPPESAPPAHYFSGLPEDQIEPCFKENLGAALALINCAGANKAVKNRSSIVFTGNFVDIAVRMNCWEVFKGWVP
jgi:carboxypeptidase T